MIELELTRTEEDHRRYLLDAVGTLRLEGLFSRNATAETGDEYWHFARSGFWQRVMQATDALGTVVGEFVPRDLRRGGTLRWGGREFTLRPASSWRERYALAEGERELVLIDGKSWGRCAKRSRRKDTSPTRRPPANSSTSPSSTPCRRGHERATGRQPCSRSRSTSATAYPSEPPTQKIGRPRVRCLWGAETLIRAREVGVP